MSTRTPGRLRCEVCDMPTLGDTLCNLHYEEQEAMSTHTPCPQCREAHAPRAFSYDGFGVNSCGMYRERLATFSPSIPDAQRKELGALWVSAPAMLEALNSAVDELNIDGTYSATELMETIETVRANLREALRLAEGEGVV